MRIAIDASNLRSGGGLTHLVQLLQAVDPDDIGVSNVTVWASSETLRQLPHRSWLLPSPQAALDQPLAARLYWQNYVLDRLAEKTCDILFVPGGSYRGRHRPFVTMSRNLLPFEASEAARFGLSWAYLKLRALRRIQSRSFAEADGLIFLNEYARATVMGQMTSTHGRWTVIPHGVNEEFMQPPRQQRNLTYYSYYSPFRLLYVSIINVYKHQTNVVKAVSSLRARGFPVELELIGSVYGPAMKRLQTVLRHLDPGTAFIRYRGAIPYDELPKRYGSADAFVFASSCENMPNILLEAMASGLPIACSDRGPMPEVLGAEGFYFDPESPEQIESAIESMLMCLPERLRAADSAFERAHQYSWKRCARETFRFLAEVKKKYG